LIHATVAMMGESFARRPGVSLFFMCALTFWLGATLALTLLREHDARIVLVLSIMLAVASLLFLAISYAKIQGGRLKAPIALLSALLMGAGLGAFGAYSVLCAQIEAESSFGMRSFRMEEDLIPRNDRYELLASYEDEAGRKHYVNLIFHENPGLLLNGEIISTQSSLQGLDPTEEFNWGKRIVAQSNIYNFNRVDVEGLDASVLKARRAALGAFEKFGGNQTGILQALICGYRGGIELTGEYEHYKTVGLAHIIAVSGSHLALVAVFVQIILRALNLRAGLRSLATIIVMCGYYVFTGCSISALRSLIMVIVAVCSYYSERRASAQNALGACVVGFICLDPFVAVSVSFALSAGSTLGIILFSTLLVECFEVKRGALRQWLIEPLALSLSSSLATSLYSAALFSQLPLISLLSNMLVGPLFGGSCVLGLVAACASVVVSAAAQPFVSLASVACVPMQFIVSGLYGVPYASVPFSASVPLMLAVSVALCVLLYLWWPSPRTLRRFLVISIALSLMLGLAIAFVRSTSDELLMLNVGQGDSFVLRSQGAALMVDTGTNDAMLSQALGRNGLRSLDALVISHPDDDHCGSLESLAQLVYIKRILVHEDMASCTCESCVSLIQRIECLRGSPELVLLKPGDQIRIGQFTCEVLWPHEYAFEGGNEDSLVMLVKHLDAEWTCLLTGDAEADELKKLGLPSDIGAVDVLKVGHHGSADALSEELLADLSPRIALISVGENNRYGHPNEDVIDLLETSGAMVCRTDISGDVSLRFTDDEIRVVSQFSLR